MYEGFMRHTTKRHKECCPSTSSICSNAFSSWHFHRNQQVILCWKKAKTSSFRRDWLLDPAVYCMWGQTLPCTSAATSSWFSRCSPNPLAALQDAKNELSVGAAQANPSDAAKWKRWSPLIWDDWFTEPIWRVITDTVSTGGNCGYSDTIEMRCKCGWGRWNGSDEYQE